MFRIFCVQQHSMAVEIVSLWLFCTDIQYLSHAMVLKPRLGLKIVQFNLCRDFCVLHGPHPLKVLCSECPWVYPSPGFVFFSIMLSATPDMAQTRIIKKRSHQVKSVLSKVESKQESKKLDK